MATPPATPPTTTPTPPVGLVTSWLPVTTAWSAPAVCSSIIWEGFPPWLALNDPGYEINVDSDISCLPSVMTQWWEQPKNLAFAVPTGTAPLTTYILGPITCPEAYTTATTSVQDSSSTFVACCPSDYSLSTVLSHGDARQCTSTITVGQEISLMLYTTITDVHEGASAWVTTISTVTSLTVVNGIQVNGWNIASQTTSSNASPSLISASITSSAPWGPSTLVDSHGGLSPTINDDKTGLDTKDIIGIGIGVSLGFIAIVALVVGGFLHRRRKRRNADLPHGLVTAPHNQVNDYYGADAKISGTLRLEEMHAGFQGHEMEVTLSPSELHGNAP